MKKLIIILLLLTGVGFIAVGGTTAYFTDTAQINNLSFTTGTLNIDDVSETWMLPVTFSDLKPGDSVTKWVIIKNIGSLDVDYLTVGKTNITDSAGFFDQLTVTTTGAVGSDPAATFTQNKPTVSSWFSNSDLLDTAYSGTAAGIIHPDESYTLSFTFEVPTSLGNSYQGKTASLDLVITAEQTH